MKILAERPRISNTNWVKYKPNIICNNSGNYFSVFIKAISLQSNWVISDRTLFIESD